MSVHSYVMLEESASLSKMLYFVSVHSYVMLEESARFTSVQNSIYALGGAHMRSIPSVRSFPNVAFETVPVCA